MENDTKPFGGQDFSGLISNLLANPAALSMLSSLLGSMGQKPSGDCADPHSPLPCEDSCAKAPPILPPASHAPHTPPPPKDDRACLLDALRPYMSKERCDMLDTLLKILELMAIFRRRRS